MTTAVAPTGTPAGKKKPKKISVTEQYSNMMDAARHAPELLEQRGVSLAACNADITITGEGQEDTKTGAWVVSAVASVAFLLVRFSGYAQWFQRRAFNHVRDAIYQRLIISILKGYYVPPLRVAAVRRDMDGLVHEEDLASAPDWTLIDGLQRATCYVIAVLMVVLGDALVAMGCIDEDLWVETFKEHINTLLTHRQALEVFYEIDDAGVLHYMLLLNSGQRQMAAKIQLELMSIPLMAIMEQHGITLVREQEKATDHKLPKTVFKGANLIVALQAFLQRDPQVKVATEIEEFLDNDSKFLAPPKEDMKQVIEVLRLVTGPLHKAVLAQSDNPVLSEGEVFTTALMAAAGEYAEQTSFGQLQEALKRLIADVTTGRDPLRLDVYTTVYGAITSGRGRKIRIIIRSAFLEYFMGTAKRLRWEEVSAVY
jgi:hypothetical protein